MAINSREKTDVGTVAQLLKLEAAAIARVADQLDPKATIQAVTLLREAGKVVVVGVGKSGIVARKVAATLTSVGTLAVALHPSEALHGDLGIVTAGDVALLFSHSGETDELLVLLPYLRERQIPIISIVGEVNSRLARASDVVLRAEVEAEVGPHQVAPTASAIAALALGDALAMVVMEKKGITKEDFARNHPAGRLGKRLTLRVQDLMRTGGENPVTSPQATWLEVLDAISRCGYGAVSVVDGERRLLGIITDGDLRRFMQTKREAAWQAQARELMTTQPVVAHPQQLAYEVLQTMEGRAKKILTVPVTDQDNRCVGLLRLHDLVSQGLL